MAKTLPYANPHTPVEYAKDFLTYLGAPLSASNVAFFSALAGSESPSAPGFNAFGTTEKLPGSTTYPGNSAGVQEYTTLEQGLQASEDLLFGGGPQTTPLAPLLAGDLKAGNSPLTLLEADFVIGNSKAGVNWTGAYSNGQPIAGDAVQKAGAQALASTPALSGLEKLRTGGGGLNPFSKSSLSAIPGNVKEIAGDAAGAVGSVTGLSGVLPSIGRGVLGVVGAVFILTGLIVISRSSPAVAQTEDKGAELAAL